MPTIQRWAFLPSELDSLQSCRPQDEFVARPWIDGYCEPELGVIVYRNGEVSNRWEDGTVGIPAELRELANEQDTLLSLDGEEIVGWRDVEVSDDGRPLRLCGVAR